jgi:hypothetical protein
VCGATQERPVAGAHFGRAGQGAGKGLSEDELIGQADEGGRGRVTVGEHG